MAPKDTAAEVQPKPAPKPIHATASSYQKPKVDKIGQPHHDIIVERLLNVLTPMKTHRSQQSVSKGKNSKKRKRTTYSQNAEGHRAESEVAKSEQPNPPPPIAEHSLLGFNHVQRHLEDLSVLSKLRRDSHSSAPGDHDSNGHDSETSRPHIAAVFLFRSPDNLLHSHLPTLCHTASLAHPDLPATRLVLLDPTTEARIVDAVGLPRVSILGFVDAQEGAPAELQSLVSYVREHVEPVAVPWLKDAREGKWMGTRIETR